MGYKITSVFSIAPNDKHRYFIYVKPSSRMYKSEIDEWVIRNFHEIAGSIGPNGVIIGPLPGKEEAYINSLREFDHLIGFGWESKKSKGKKSKSGINSFLNSIKDDDFNLEEYFNKINENPYSFKEKQEDDLTTDFLHSHDALLIVTRRPLNLDDFNKSDAIIINLSYCKSEYELSQTFDVIIQMIKNDDPKELHNLKFSDSERFDNNIRNRFYRKRERSNYLEFKKGITGVGKILSKWINDTEEMFCKGLFSENDSISYSDYIYVKSNLIKARKLIANNETLNAINILKDCFSGTEKEDEIIIHKSTFLDLQKKLRLNLISYEDGIRLKSKLDYSILKFIMNVIIEFRRKNI